MLSVTVSRNLLTEIRKDILTSYRVILIQVSFGIFRTIVASKEEKITIKGIDKVLSLSKFSCYSVVVKIIKSRHLKGHVSQKKS